MISTSRNRVHARIETRRNRANCVGETLVVSSSLRPDPLLRRSRMPSPAPVALLLDPFRSPVLLPLLPLDLIRSQVLKQPRLLDLLWSQVLTHVRRARSSHARMPARSSLASPALSSHARPRPRAVPWSHHDERRSSSRASLLGSSPSSRGAHAPSPTRSSPRRPSAAELARGHRPSRSRAAAARGARSVHQRRQVRVFPSLRASLLPSHGTGARAHGGQQAVVHVNCDSVSL
jgi:hypothetical protein